MRIYIIRHADPDYDKGTITKHGHKEAAALAKRLQHSGIDKIYSSPMQRAIDTMEYTRKSLSIEPIIQDWMQEINWMEGKSDVYKNPWDVPAEIILNQDHHPSHENWHQLDEYAGLDLVREFDKLQVNSDEFLRKLGYVRKGRLYQCINHNEERIAIFCHAGFGLSWLAHLLQIPLSLAWASFWLAPSSVTTVVFDKRSENYAMPRCIGLGDVSHLYDAKLPTRPRGLPSILKNELLK